MMELLEIFWTFFTIGLFTIGGGYAMIPMIRSEVISKGWLGETELVDFMAVSESTPGPFAVNIATFIGESQHGVLGAIAATLGVILPSFIIIILVYNIYQKIFNNKYVDGTMSGIKAVVVGLIFSVVVSLAIDEIFKAEISFKGIDYKAIIIMAIIGGIFIWKKKTNPILMILLSAGLGILMYGVL